MKKVLFTAVVMLGLTAATHAQVPNYVPTNGLVAWWPFNGNADDESGNGNNGTVNGATMSSDRFGNIDKAFLFGNSDTTNIRITDNSSLDLIGSFTISAWYLPLDLSPINYAYRPIISKASNEDMGAGGFVTGISSFSNPIRFDFQGGNPYVSNVSAFGITDFVLNQWRFITITYSQQLGLLKYFDNAILTDSIAINLNLNNTNLDLFVGNHFNANNSSGLYRSPWFGKIDDIGIWNRALSQEEITALYNAETCASNTSNTPQTNALPIGSTATFTASTSDPNPIYVWQSDLGQGFQTLSDVGNYTGTSTATLTIANVQLSEHNQPIRVISTSGECVDTSEAAVISILDTCITTIVDTSFVSVTDTLIINTLITGINTPNASNTIKVFPNPANTHISIDYGNFALMNGYELRIENSLGQQVFQTNITQQSDFLSLATWGGNGLYFVHIVDPQGNTVDIRKIVLQ